VDFSSLYRTYARDVHRFALFLSGDPALADDIVSETFIRVWKARERVDLSTVKAYLLAIARNVFLQHVRRVKRHVNLDELDERIADSRPGPHEQADARNELRAVMASLQSLPEVDRAALLMRTDAAVPYEDIARALGISVSAAKVKVHRARQKLADASGRAERDTR
jgi:RNA polymerase sigma-70 factor, ECF subfamily